MNDRQLRYILEIAKERNLTEAAKNLYISQPSLSNLLDHVEKEMGCKLFIRRPGRMVLTVAGERYVETARQILGSMATLEQELSEIRNEDRGRLTIGVSRKISSVLFPYVLPPLRKKYPRYQFRLVESPMEELSTRLISGDVDVAFLYGEITGSHIKSFVCYREEICIIAPSGFTSDAIVYGDNGIDMLTDLSALKEKEFVLFKKGLGLRTIADDIFHANNIYPNILLETDSWHTCLSMVDSCGTFSLLPFSPHESLKYTRSDGTLSFKPLIPVKHYHRTLRAHYRAELENNRALRDLLSLYSEMRQTVRYGD